MSVLVHGKDGLGNLPYGSVVIDCDGEAWQKHEILDKWVVVGIDDKNPYIFIEDYFPVKVVYKPDEA